MSISLVWGYFRLPQSVPDVFDLGIVSPKMSFQTSNRDIMLKSDKLINHIFVHLSDCSWYKRYRSIQEAGELERASNMTVDVHRGILAVIPVR